MKTNRPPALLFAAGLSLLAGCNHEPTDTDAGFLNVALTTPNNDDGAVLFTVSGGPVDSVEAAGYSVYSAQIDANTLRVIVTGALGSGSLARLHIPNNRQNSGYSATVNQVAARATYQPRDPTSYSVTLEP
jgi:hypothetical protein